MKKAVVLFASIAALVGAPLVASAKPPVKKPDCTWVNDRNGGKVVCSK